MEHQPTKLEGPTVHPSELSFRKSSYSNPQNCVEVADLPEGAAIRDSKRPEVGPLSFPTIEWRAFLDSVKGEQL
ncbi:DUF397 domain-containing protein [Halostreptopolyspora alba]|uniref:DUF397 domain-containing protein n=1 Tax=Halostreptopolyspora alba TaxID=2487137 RepID=A0A3N0E958_9ACTN|nr:DUF397 domain-containing protein [Nocardiopsaceae bacterium YIM 96095]